MNTDTAKIKDMSVVLSGGRRAPEEVHKALFEASGLTMEDFKTLYPPSQRDIEAIKRKGLGLPSIPPKYILDKKKGDPKENN